MSPDVPTRKRPGRRSIVATHPRREQIEAACAAGISLRKIADRFGVGIMSVHRHWHSLPVEHRAALSAAIADQEDARWREVITGLAAIAQRHPAVRADIADLASRLTTLMPASTGDHAHAA